MILDNIQAESHHFSISIENFRKYDNEFLGAPSLLHFYNVIRQAIVNADRVSD